MIYLFFVEMSQSYDYVNDSKNIKSLLDFDNTNIVTNLENMIESLTKGIPSIYYIKTEYLGVTLNIIVIVD